MRENAQYLPAAPSSTNLSPLSPVTSSSSTTESPPAPDSPPTSWSSRHLSPNIRRDSLTSLFSGTGSTSLKSKIPRLNLKKRFKKQVDSETHPVSDSARLTRARHTPLVGLGISGVDPFSESQRDEPERIVREDSDATLMPPRQRPSYSSRCSDDASETSPTCGTTSSSSILSARASVDDADFRTSPSLLRAYSADLLAHSKRRTPAELLRAHSEDLWSRSRQEAASECGSPTRTASSSFTLKRFRSGNPFSTGNRSISDGAQQKPVVRAQKSRFNSAFSFSDDDSESSSSYSQLAGRLRRVRGVSKLSKQFGWSKLDVGADVALPPDTSSNDLLIKNENRQSYDEQVCSALSSSCSVIILLTVSRSQTSASSSLFQRMMSSTLVQLTWLILTTNSSGIRAISAVSCALQLQVPCQPAIPRSQKTTSSSFRHAPLITRHTCTQPFVQVSLASSI